MLTYPDKGTFTMDFTEFKRRVATPHWCEGDPLLWEARDYNGKVGIADLARDCKVGKFNLCWWLMACDKPPPPSTYRATPLVWALMTAPTITLNGQPLVDVASMVPLHQFNERMRRVMQNLTPEVQRIICNHGVTPDRLLRLTYRGMIKP